MKFIIKEIIVMLILILAILLVLGIFLYDYVPSNKVVPKIEQYEAPDNIKEELEESIEDIDTSIIVHEINSNDLNIYEKSKDYKKGKVNPFSTTQSNTISDNGSNTNNSNSSNTSNNLNTNNNNSENKSSSEGSYLPNNGAK